MPLSDAALGDLVCEPPASSGLVRTTRGAIYKAAVAIQNEDSQADNHAARVWFANAVINNPATKLTEKARMMLGDILVDATIAALPDPNLADDITVENRVNGLLSIPAKLANYGT